MTVSIKIIIFLLYYRQLCSCWCPFMIPVAWLARDCVHTNLLDISLLCKLQFGCSYHLIYHVTPSRLWDPATLVYLSVNALPHGVTLRVNKAPKTLGSIKYCNMYSRELNITICIRVFKYCNMYSSVLSIAICIPVY